MVVVFTPVFRPSAKSSHLLTSPIVCPVTISSNDGSKKVVGGSSVSFRWNNDSSAPEILSSDFLGTTTYDSAGSGGGECVTVENFPGWLSVASLGKRRSHKVFLRREHDNNDD